MADCCPSVQTARSTRLRVCTWNVWMEVSWAEERFDALVRTLLARAPDVICLQEVVPRFAASLRASSLVASQYTVSNNDVGPYSVLLLARIDLCPVFRQVELESAMGRSLLIAELDPRRPEERWKRGAVATVHLESLNSASVRRAQLATCSQELGMQSALPNAVLAGDFNFDDTQEWGDWREAPVTLEEATRLLAEADGCRQGQQARPIRPAHELENRVLDEVMTDFADVWPLLRPGERGATFDGGANPVCVTDSDEVMRYDRVLLRAPRGAARCDSLDAAARWVAQDISMVGVEAINTEGVRPSDHFGLMVDIVQQAKDVDEVLRR